MRILIFTVLVQMTLSFDQDDFVSSLDYAKKNKELKYLNGVLSNCLLLIDKHSDDFEDWLTVFTLMARKFSKYFYFKVESCCERVKFGK